MSNRNNRIGSKAAGYVRVDNTGMFVTPGPFIGIVKNNLDPTCSGRLQVYIPQLGAANEDDPSSWITVNYASPFRGQTKRRGDVAQYVDKNIDSTADFDSVTENSFQSYGFWFVPPDINIKVLTMFVNGDPSQGYWFACVGDAFDSHMVPASGSSVAAASASSGGYLWDPSKLATHKALQTYIELVDPDSGATEIPLRLPTAEAVQTAQDNINNVANLQKVPLVYQSQQLGIQGLAFDQGRGTTTASALRENPSQVFGMSSPGRLSVFKDAATSKKLLALIQSYVDDPSGTSADDLQTVTSALNSKYRTGGHSIVLDDGTVEGKDQGIRIRSASGNTILMDDTNGQIYVINAPGTAWIELSPSGMIDVYAQSDFSVRSKGNINLHADQNVSINAGGAVNIHSGADSQIESSGDLTFRSTGDLTAWSGQTLQLGSGGQLVMSSKGNFGVQSDGVLNLNGTTTNVNCQSGSKITDPGALSQNKLVDTGKISGREVWWQTGKITSIVSRAPAHEPWPQHEINSIVTATVSQGSAISQPIISNGSTSGVRGSTKSGNVNSAALAAQPDPADGVCGLSKTQTKALLAQIGQSESGGVYNKVNSIGYVGKYQFGAAALETQGYLKSGSSKTGTNKTVNSNSANWTGKNGCNSQSDWLSNPSVQESAMITLLQANCKYLRKVGVITSATSASDVGGYLQTAHLLGPGGAVQYSQYVNGQGGSNGTDANGTSAGKYFAQGSAAVNLGTSVQNS